MYGKVEYIAHLSLGVFFLLTLCTQKNRDKHFPYTIPILYVITYLNFPVYHYSSVKENQNYPQKGINYRKKINKIRFK